MEAESVLKNIKSNYIRFIIISLLGLGSTIIFSRILGAEQYGILSYLLWLISFISVFIGLGIPPVMTKFIPEYYFNNNFKETKRLLLHSIIFQGIVFVFFTIIVYFLFDSISTFLKVLPLRNRKLLFFLAIACSLPFSLNQIYEHSIKALQRFDIFSKVSIRVSTATFFSSLLIILIYPNFYVVILVSLFGYIYQTYYYSEWYIKFTKLKKSEVSLILSKLKDLPRILHYSFFLYVNILCQQIIFARSELFFIGLYLSANEVATYSIAFSLISVISALTGTMMSVINNYFSKLVAKKDREGIQNVLGKTTRIISFICFFILSFGYFFSGFIINFVFLEDYLHLDIIFLILFSGLILNIVLGVSSTLSVLFEGQKFVALLGVILGMINILLNIALIPKYGVIGAAISSIFVQTIMVVINLVYIVFQTKIRHEFGKSLLLFFVSFIFIVGSFFVVEFKDMLIVSILFSAFYIFVALKIKAVTINEIKNILDINNLK